MQGYKALAVAMIEQAGEDCQGPQPFVYSKTGQVRGLKFVENGVMVPAQGDHPDFKDFTPNREEVKRWLTVDEYESLGIWADVLEQDLPTLRHKLIKRWGLEGVEPMPPFRRTN